MSVFVVVQQGDHSLSAMVFEDRQVAEEFAATAQEFFGPHVGVWVLQTALVPKEEQ